MFRVIEGLPPDVFAVEAVVTDHAWIRAMTAKFTPFMPAEVRLVSLPDLPAAKEGIVGSRGGA